MLKATFLNECKPKPDIANFYRMHRETEIQGKQVNYLNYTGTQKKVFCTSHVTNDFRCIKSPDDESVVTSQFFPNLKKYVQI